MTETETLQKGQIYEFEVLSKMEISSGKKFYSLKRGERETYRVPLFLFQELIPSPLTIQCLVKEINPMNGLPMLVQDRYSLYKELFSEDRFYIFNCMSDEVERDSNGAAFISIEDEYGFRHKYYFGPHEEPEITDYIGLKIKYISDKGFLGFEYRADPNAEALAEAKGDYIAPELQQLDILEDQYNEFKSSIAFPAAKVESDIREQLDVIVKTLAGFMNAEGGTLFIGVNDRGHICGINQDFPHLNSDPGNDFEYKMNTDGYELRIRDAVKKLIGNFANGKMKFKFFKTDSNLLYCTIEVPALHRPVFMKGTLLYQRAGNTTQLLKGDDITIYIEERLLNRQLAEPASIPTGKPELDEASTELSKNEELNPEQLLPLPKVENAESRKPWTYFSWYKDGSWSFQSKSMAADPDFYKEILLYADDKEKQLLICYDNGHMNVVIPKKIKSKKDSGKRYKNGWNQEAEIVDLFAANPYDLIAAYSKDISGTDMIKLHEVAHFNPVASIQGKGLTIVNNRLGNVTDYKLIDVIYRQALSGLIEPKNRTSSSLGIAAKSISHKAEIKLLNSI